MKIKTIKLRNTFPKRFPSEATSALQGIKEIVYAPCGYITGTGREIPAPSKGGSLVGKNRLGFFVWQKKK